jgi:nucleosome assembly protein 1-like 1
MIKVISSMPAQVQNRFKVLHMLSDERSKINDEFEKERKALEEKFREVKKPLLEKRNDIVLAKTTDYAEYLPTYDETYMKVGTIVAGIVKSEKDKEDDAIEAGEHKPTDVAHLKEVEGVPDFWTVAVKNNQMMMQYIREKDRETLPFLTNVTSVEVSEPKSITIELTFKENDWFTNDKLKLTIKFKKDQDDEVAETEGTIVDWKDGKDLTNKKIKKKQKNKKTGETRTISKTVPAESFFNCFESRKAPEDKEEDEDAEDEEHEKLLDALDESMQVAMDFNDLYNWEALEFYLNFGQNMDGLMG